jgi:hypothetical protein
MSGPKRTLLSRRRKGSLSPEMIELYRRGREIQKAGAAEKWEAQGGRRAEFLDITKRLDITLLRRAWHEVSVLDDLDGEPPGYMVARNSNQFPDFNGWYSGRELQCQLDAALAKTECA